MCVELEVSTYYRIVAYDRLILICLFVDIYMHSVDLSVYSSIPLLLLLSILTSTFLYLSHSSLPLPLSPSHPSFPITPITRPPPSCPLCLCALL